MIQCNKSRLTSSIKKFSEFGKTRHGGITRLSLSQEDVEARKEFCKECRSLGLTVRIDDLGNIYAESTGSEDLPPIILGSHIDSVEKGGNYDGILGILSALEVAETLKENKIQLRHPLIVMDFTNEEGARFEPSMMSSGILTGYYEKEKMFQTKDRMGLTFAEALSESGFSGEESNRIKKGCAYIELHIEQGPVLESEKEEIGVVEGVVGMVCYEFKISGVSDHAGTTPMNLRVDSLIFTSKFITDLYEKLIKVADDMVFTIGRFDVKPDIHTIIPSDVVFTLDIRHKSPEVIKQAEAIVEKFQEEEKHSTKCRIIRKKVWQRKTVDYDQDIVNQVEKSSNGLGYHSKRMYSGAGHDAEFMASMLPTAMIFVPSIQGKSHCEDERTSFDDCVKGANVLLHTVLNIDRMNK